MNHFHSKQNSSTISILLTCAIVFLVFSFSYLYFFQADVLALAQHVLSNGLTHYNRLIGAVLITLTLQLLQLLVYAFTRLRKRTHALTYVPSLLVLAMITDVSSDIDCHFSMGGWWWAFPLVIVVWVLIVIFARFLREVEPMAEPVGLFSRAMWINMFTMCVLIICVLLISNTNAVFHYRMRAESALREGDFVRALEVGKKSLETDADLQMIRMYALSRTGEMAERLFSYPVAGNSSVMLPIEGKSHFAMYPVDSLYKYLGAKPGNPMTISRYLELLQERDSDDDKRIADYQLCGLLLDKRIDDFVRELRNHYTENDTLDIDRLPKHYREAMTLYTHLRLKPLVIYHNAVMDEDWKNLQELQGNYSDKTERKGKVEELYRGTYWYYYEYE